RSLLQRVFFGPTRRRLIQELSGIRPNAAILDVGCGTGQLAEEILQWFPKVKVRGLDLSVKMIEMAEVRCAEFGERAEFCVGDSEKLPWTGGRFDVVICTHSFHHYPNQAAVLAEFARVLKPDGELMLVDADRDTWYGRFFFDGIVNWLEGGVHHCSEAEFRQKFAAAGFEVESRFRQGGVMPWQLLRGRKRAATAKKSA
ncbi:MAG TPA: class I SAM-dependent methyltransferase, partial [Planctomycetia bacterium]|nr:class I SAM-dependent methyltransferase [Planctomycetia bacterium]